MKIENFKKYKKLYLVGVLFITALFFSPILDLMLSYLNSKFGIWTAVILGYFYSFSFTSGAASVMISNIESNFFLFAVLSATGSMFADFTILKILKFNFEEEIKDLFNFVKIEKYLNNKHKIIIAILVIGSPLPDEIGVILLSQTKKFSKVNFLILCFIANFIFVYFIAKSF